MMLRSVLAVIAWGLAFAVLYAALSWQASPPGFPLWQLHILAATVCGVSASSMIAGQRPYLYGLFVVLALLIPVAGPLFVLLLGTLAPKETHTPKPGARDPFICGVPLRDCRRSANFARASSFISSFGSLSDAQLDHVLSDVVKLEEAPLMSLNRKFRDHPNTHVMLVGQGCVAERLNVLERHARNLRCRVNRNPENPDALLGLCEIHLAVLEQKLLMPQEGTIRARSGLEVVRQLRSLAEREKFEQHSAFYEAHFALYLGQRDRAVGAWEQLVETTERGCILDPGDRFHLLGAEVSLVRGDLSGVCEHVQKLEPDSPAKFWLQEFWLEPARREAS